MAEYVLRHRHRYKTGFTVLDNEGADDRRLSLRAKGTLWVLWRWPDDKPISAEALAAEVSEGRDACRTALNELAAAGYLRRTIVRNDAGQLRTAAELADQSVFAGGTDDGKPGTGKPTPDNQAPSTQVQDQDLPLPYGSGPPSKNGAKSNGTDTAQTVLAAFFERHDGLTLSATSRNAVGRFLKSNLAAGPDALGRALDAYADAIAAKRRVQPHHLAGMLDVALAESPTTAEVPLEEIRRQVQLWQAIAADPDHEEYAGAADAVDYWAGRLEAYWRGRLDGEPADAE
jgi:hypothetical protein